MILIIYQGLTSLDYFAAEAFVAAIKYLGLSY